VSGEDSRLDVECAARGLARSRTHAQELIEAGRVRVSGKQVIKPAHRVGAETAIAVEGLDHYVSRGAHKLIAALDAFDIAIAGKRALDVGASTGGFTQVLLERGAREVVALDVGRAQLSAGIRSDDRVHVVEGVNAKGLTAANLDALVGARFVPEIVVADLSFISLTHVMPALRSTAPDADFVLLIKPQFEVGRTGIREGIVTNPALREDAITAVLWSAFDVGLGAAGLIPSPILGGHGNHEYLVWLSNAAGRNPSEWVDTVHRVAGVLA
jgi:23S rRNA (cytidine1920-2'-O)/16S rRNA (cytidine1409-2'-O)-methyltransferase